VFTREDFEDFVKSVVNRPYSPPVMVMSPSLAKAWDELIRTKTVKTIGNYSLRELDGRRWWSRNMGINEDLDIGIFPRDVAEGYTPCITFNRHQRRHGLPATMDSYAEFRKRFPRA
jgi:hypothetical protein